MAPEFIRFVNPGDLRIAHMLGLHAMQIFPLFAFFLARSTPAWRETSRVKTVFAFTTVYVIASATMLYIALEGLPLLPLAIRLGSA